MRHGVFVYPWDIAGDPRAVDRIAGLGAGIVSLAAAYHTVRAFTPHHPQHRLVEAAHAAAYFRVRDDRWADQRLQPDTPDWLAYPDSFGTAREALATAGLGVHAWLVLCHSTRLGWENPDVVVRSAFGDSYPYALCPSHEDVRTYVARLVAEVVDQYPVAALELEACGWLGFRHGSRHDRSGVDLSQVDQELLSICLCPACTTQLAVAGVDAGALAARIRTVVDEGLAGAPRPSGGSMAEQLAELVGAEVTAVFTLRGRTIATLLESLRGAAAGVPLLVLANPDPGHTGNDVGVDLAHLAGRADGVIVKANGGEDEVAGLIGAARAALPAGTLVEASLNTLLPRYAATGELAERTRLLGKTGTDGVRFYHAGLASPARLDAIRTATA